MTDPLTNDTFLLCEDMEANNTADRIQIGYQLFALAIGTPLNLLVLYRLTVALRLQYSRALSLYLLLNISNLLILLVHCTGYSIWMMQFWWFGGDLLCRLYTFLNTFAFHLSSNALVAIALDLYGSVRFPMQTRRNGRSRVTIFIVISVAAALLTAIPQLFLWGLEFVQCLDYQETRPQCAFMNTSRGYANLYSVIHTVLMFWLPLVIITPAYVSVSLEVIKHYRGAGVSNSSGLDEKDSDRILTLKSSKCWKFAKSRLQYHSVLIGGKSLRRSYADPQRIREKRNRVLISSLTIVTVYLVSWLPYQISSILQVVNADATVLPYLECLEALMIFDTIINPFLYRFIDKKPLRNSHSPLTLQATRPPSNVGSSTEPPMRSALTYMSSESPTQRMKLISCGSTSGRLSDAKRVSFV